MTLFIFCFRGGAGVKKCIKNLVIPIKAREDFVTRREKSGGSREQRSEKMVEEG